MRQEPLESAVSSLFFRACAHAIFSPAFKYCMCQTSTRLDKMLQLREFVGVSESEGLEHDRPMCNGLRAKESRPAGSTPIRIFESTPALSELDNTGISDMNIATANGQSANTSRGASPNPPQSQMPPVPNGKPTSPYSERTNPMSPNAQIAAQTVSSKDPKAAAQAASDMRNVVRRKLTGYVGFANLPNQWHRKSVRKGFNFNVMVVGTFNPSIYDDKV